MRRQQARPVKVIDIPYKPRPIWRDVIHPALEHKKRAVLVCHRRFGKTIGCINEMIRKALQNTKLMPKYAYVAPYKNQAKKIAWSWLKYYTRVIRGRKVNEVELYVEFPTLHEGADGTRIYIIGADKPDNLRGDYLDGVILDEFAQIRPSLYGEIIAPMLVDRDGFAYIVGTPKGQNQFYEKYKEAVNDPDRWFSCLYRASESGVLSQEKIEDLSKDMTAEQKRQELECDFSASASNIVLPIDLVDQAAARNITEEQVAELPLVLAVDVARFGDDDTRFQLRRGLLAYPSIKVHGMDTMVVAAMTVALINQYHPDAVFIDVGAMGAGVIDRIRQLGYPVIEVNFESQAQNTKRFKNLRAEMYFKTRDWMQQGGCIPDDPELKTELSVVEYRFSGEGRIILQPKEEIKEILGRSPDRADALAMTFAYPVAAASVMQQATANTEYNFDV